MMKIELNEHHKHKFYSLIGNDLKEDKELFEKYKKISPRLFPGKRDKRPCFKVYISNEEIHLEADYYIGVDWLIENEKFIQVKPKLNKQLIAHFEQKADNDDIDTLDDDADSEKKKIIESEIVELNYIKILMDAMAHPELIKQIQNLVIIDWKKPSIPVSQKDDALTPFLVIQFLNLLKEIVNKGLKKSYYKVTEHLNSKVKGKILVGEHIKKNVFKNRFTKIYCEYQEFGINHKENQFLKKALKFAKSYVATNNEIFGKSINGVNELINFCSPAFERVENHDNDDPSIIAKFNPFFKEYKEAIQIGHHLIKKISYNLTDTSNNLINTPPFWIDMPLLFELYVYHQLLKEFKTHEIKFQFSTYGNKLDFLIIRYGSQMVVDAKYKMHYQSHHIHNDIRQVSGYSRLNKVYNELNRTNSNELVSCLIIYPSDKKLNQDDVFKCELNDNTRIKAYRDIFKIGLSMPYI